MTSTRVPPSHIGCRQPSGQIQAILLVAAVWLGPTRTVLAAWGDSTISAMAGPWPITISTAAHNAGAITSLRWGSNNKQYINDFDHGRQLQSASSFDGLGEAFNPTEAGSAANGANPSPSSSVLQGLSTWSSNGTGVHNVLATQTQMAFWNPVSGATVSNHILNKQVTIGLPGMAHVIEYRTQFTIPANETHTHGVFEVLTGYMPEEFSQFYTYDVKNGATNTAPLSDGPGEQSLPIIFALANGNHAMGIYSPDSPQQAWPTAGYGRWRFPTDDVVKWNNVFRIDNPAGVYNFRSYVVVGSLENVKVSMDQLYASLLVEERSWNLDQNGSWNTGTNWLQTSVPNSNQTPVMFGNAISQDRTITTSGTVTAKSITFDNSRSYTIGGAGTVQLEASSGDAQLSVVQGDHQFSAAVVLNSNTLLDVSAGDQLTFSGSLNLAGRSLTKTGSGTLLLNTGAIGSGGQLIANAGTIAGTGTLMGNFVNTGGILSPGNPASSVTAPLAVAVPEPNSSWPLILLMARRALRDNRR